MLAFISDELAGYGAGVMMRRVTYQCPETGRKLVFLTSLNDSKKFPPGLSILYRIKRARCKIIDAWIHRPTAIRFFLCCSAIFFKGSGTYILTPEKPSRVPLLHKDRPASDFLTGVPAWTRNIRVQFAPTVGYLSSVTYLDTAVHAAKQAGQLLRENFHLDKTVDEATQHDIKLALDKESQELITGILLKAYPTHGIYGEEGLAGDQSSPFHWIVDPIDGTVNYRYCIPHFCVSIALREGDELILGVIYDPMVDELWTVERGGTPLLNGREIACSDHTDLTESIIFVGFGKDVEAQVTGLERFQRVSPKVRKMRMMGSAALGTAYVASGRLDAYIESRISLWDIAAGKLLIEAGGGRVDLTPHPNDPDVYSIVATNGKIPIDELL